MSTNEDTPPYLPDIEDLPPIEPDHEADAAELDAMTDDDGGEVEYELPDDEED